VGFAINGFLNVFPGGFDPCQGAQMGMGMHRLGFGRGAE
jgi:hypothetical protein